MKNALPRAALLAVAIGAAPTALSAQIFTPTFMSPRAQASIGGYLSDQDPGDFAAEAILRSNFGGYELGLRGGVVDAGGTDLTIGVEYRNPLGLVAAPIDAAVTAGAQGLFGDFDAWGVQVGLSLGATVVPGNFAVTPYIHPRVALVDYGGGSDAEADLLAEIGADVEFDRGFAVRFAVALDDVGSDWGIGLSWAR